MRESKLKILELIDTLSPGGGQRFVVDLSNELSKSHYVYLGQLRNKLNSDFYESELNNNVRLIKCNGRFTLLSKIVQIFKIINLIRVLKPDIVHSHLVTFNYIVLPFFIFRKIKFYYTVHNLAEKDTGAGFNKLLKTVLFKNRIRAITISDVCEESFCSFFGYNSFKMIENGCRAIKCTNSLDCAREEISAYITLPNTRIFINVARITEQKNHKLLINAFNDFAKNKPNVILFIIGSYEANLDLKNELSSMIIDNRIIFLGTKTNIADYLALSDYFCLSSSWEGLPISLLEAGLSGAYPICTPVGGIPDVIIDSSWGVLSDNLSVESYSKALSEALEISTHRNDLQNLYQGRYLMSNCALNYESVFMK